MTILKITKLVYFKGSEVGMEFVALRGELWNYKCLQ
jgi:hypothetical protein